MDSLPLPPKHYDPANKPGFETAAKSETEDSIRAGQLRRAAAGTPADRRPLLALADCIDPDVTDHPDTLASHRCMRDYRRRIIGALWQMLDE